VVVETHDEWQVAERRYLSETSMAQLRRDEKAAIAEGSGEALENKSLDESVYVSRIKQLLRLSHNPTHKVRENMG